MAVNKDNIIFERRVGNAASQVVSEGEITAFEGKPEVETLLRAEGSFTTEDISCSDNRVSFSGVLKVEGMYLSGGDVRTVHCFSTEMPISDYINVEGAAEGMYTYAAFNVSRLDCHVAKGHKLTYRAVIDTEVTVYEDAACQYVYSVDDIPANQQRFDTVSAESVPLRLQESITLRESLDLPMGKPNVEEIICSDVRLSSVETKAGENSVRMSGDLNISILYKGEGESNPMELYEESIPFKGELEAKGLTGDMLCSVRQELKSADVSVQPDEDGEMRVIDVAAVIGADIRGRRTTQADVLEDMYVLNRDVRFDFQEMCCCVCAAKNTGQCSVKNVVTLDEKAPGMLQIYKADGKTYVDYVQVNDGSIDIEGAVAVNIVYVTGNDEIPVYCFSSMLPFRHTAQAAGAGEGMDCHVEAHLEHIGFNMLSDREVEVRCVINICAAVEDVRCINLVSDVELEDMSKEYLGSLASITLYIVRKGDTLWKLAKRFNTTVEDIAAVNDIENPDLIYPGQRLIIVKTIA